MAAIFSTKWVSWVFSIYLGRLHYTKKNVYLFSFLFLYSVSDNSNFCFVELAFCKNCCCEKSSVKRHTELSICFVSIFNFGHKKFEDISRLFWLYWVNVKTSWIFFQILWPSHNVLTLSFYCMREVIKLLAYQFVFKNQNKKHLVTETLFWHFWQESWQWTWFKLITLHAFWQMTFHNNNFWKTLIQQILSSTIFSVSGFTKIMLTRVVQWSLD